jgi:2-haloacid dehalogenase
MANTLVFDIGKVLIRWDAEIPYRRLIPDDDARAAFFRDVLPPEWNLEQDRGRTWAEAEAEKIAAFPKYADLIRAYRKHWHETVPGDIPDNVAVLERALAAGIPCYAITNFAADTFREAQARFPFLTRFAGIVVSAEERLIKPDPAIFEVFLTRYGMRAGDCLFMDDSAANIATAQSLGFATIHVTDGMDLARAVRGFGFAI